MSAHRGHPVRPRYGRIGTAATSLTVTLIAILGGAGALPSAADEPVRDPSSESASERQVPDRDASAADDPPSGSSLLNGRVATGSESRGSTSRDTALPAGTGTGTRVVLSESRQRVWLVEGRGRVLRTYLVSGSTSDNLDPGTYTVYSRSEQAWGIDDSGTMRWFVRFTQGDSGAAIGFHTIPIDDGERVQTTAELGTPRSHGCIRQRTADAKALWDFAPVGTTVVVTA